MKPLGGQWRELQSVVSRAFKCGFCGNKVASDKGWKFENGSSPVADIRVCSHCRRPTFFEASTVVPAPPAGNDVTALPANIEALYAEARRCTASNAHTAAVLACRKLLMHIAVNKGAQPGARFVDYVDFLDANHYTPPGSKTWVDHIRLKGNEANHEIVLMTIAEAAELIDFSEMLLRFIYEFPSRLNPAATP